MSGREYFDLFFAIFMVGFLVVLIVQRSRGKIDLYTVIGFGIVALAAVSKALLHVMPAVKGVSHLLGEWCWPIMLVLVAYGRWSTHRARRAIAGQ